MRILPLAAAALAMIGADQVSTLGTVRLPTTGTVQLKLDRSWDVTSADEAPYRTQFENEWVKLVRVRYPANSKVPVHGHPTSVTAFVYLSESSPVRFTHQGKRTHVVTRQPTTPGGFRISRGGDEEHAVENLGPIASDFLRVEFKTDTAGDGSPYHRDSRRLTAGASTAAEVRFTNEQMRVTRIAVPAGGAAEIAAAANQPALILAIGDAALTAAGAPLRLANGQERWIAPGQSERWTNSGASAVELLRIDFLTPPRK